MTNTHSTLRHGTKGDDPIEHWRITSLLWQPAIPFHSKETKTKHGSKNGNSSDEEEGDTVTINVKVNSNDGKDEKNFVAHKVPKFSGGTPEEYCTWRNHIDEFFIQRGCTDDPKQQIGLYRSLLTGKALIDFRTAYNRESQANADQPSKSKRDLKVIINRALNEVALRIFKHGKDAYKIQRRYLRTRIPIGTMAVKTYTDRLERINTWFQYFPVETKTIVGDDDDLPPPLDDDEIMDLLHFAQPVEWNIRNLQQGKHGFFDDLLSMTDAYALYQDADQLQREVDKIHNRTRTRDNQSQSRGNNNGNDRRNSSNPRRKRKGRGNGINREEEPRPPKKSHNDKKNNEDHETCPHCGRNHKKPWSDCWSLPANKNNRPDWFKDNHNNGKSSEQHNHSILKGQSHVLIKSSMLKKLVNQAAKRRRMVIEDSDSSTGEEGSLGAFAGMDNNPNNYMEELRNSTNDSSEAVSPYSLFPFHTPVPPQKKTKQVHYTAEIIVETMNREGQIVPINALLDTGTSSTIILRHFVKKGAVKSDKHRLQQWNTLGGKFFTKRQALIDFKFPELDNTKKVTWSCHIDESTTKANASYDMIIGMDLMTNIGIFVNTSSKTIDWHEASIPLKQRGQLQESHFLEAIYHQAMEPEVLKAAETRQKQILDADYTKVEVQPYVQEQKHLSHEEKDQLAKVLQSHPTLFGGGLGELKIKPIALEIKPGAKPYHARAYPIPQAYEAGTKKEIDRFVSIGIMERNHDSEWAAATFIQPKKTGDIRVLTDFRQLNLVLKRQPFPLPKISDLLLKLKGFQYATALDLSMGYYHIPLDEASQRLCTTVLPWGKYRYKRLPMGISSAPDIFQSIMAEILGDLDFCRVYIDDILIISNGTFEDHMQKLEIVLKRLEERGFRANIRKCFFARDELEYLGYWLTRQGIQPQPKKVEAICRLTAPQNRRQLRHFLGMVNYYRDMWRRRSHIIAPLSALTSKDVPWKWGAEQQEAFEEVKRVISEATLLAFPRFDKPFHVHTDASKYQLGSVIMQEGRPLAFYSRKLNSAQKNYTTGEQELLSIVETLKEFRNILLGQKVIVHTDHKNILYGNLSSDRIIRWRLLLEEYGPEYHHIKGENNIVADALSRMEQDSEAEDSIELGPLGSEIAHCMTTLTRDESIELPTNADLLGMATCFAGPNEVAFERFPMRPALISEEQKKDKIIQKNFHSHTKEFKTRRVEDSDLLTYQGKIVIPSSLQGRIIEWYHKYLAHPGETRMEATLRGLYTWPNMRAQIQYHVRKCRQCQLGKGTTKKYGHLPAKDIEKSEPWNRVNVDLIGPWSVKTPKGVRTLRALTIIDPATGWFEMKEIESPDSSSTAAAIDDVWFSRYPRPQIIGYDGGSEFKHVFAQTIANYGLVAKTTTAYNPQANGIIERVHQVVTDALRTFELEEQNLDEKDPWTPFLQAACFAIRSTYHTTLGATPAQLVFGRDMILPLQFKANWAAIHERRSQQILRDNKRENDKRIPHEYKVGDKVTKARPGIQPKLRQKRDGPFEVIAVYNNGTLRIRQGAVTERVNIRRLMPYTE
jgi:transposase InsO family protein